MLVSASTFQDALFLLLGDGSTKAKALVKEFIEVHDKAAHKKEILTADDDLVSTYKSFIKSVLAENITQENETASKMLLLKVKSNEVIKSHPVIRDILTDILTSSEKISAEQINEYTKRIRNVLVQADIEATTRRIFAKNKVIADITDAQEQEAELEGVKKILSDALKSIEAKQMVSDSKSSETYVKMSDRDSLLKSMNVFIDRSVRGVIKTGLQGLNKAMGKRGGMGLGETWVFAASSHNFKSGMLVAIMVWTIIYNKLVVTPGKKALVYFVSLENEVNQNLMDVFTVLYCRIEKKNVDISTMSSEFITDWLYTYFAQFDVELIIDRYTPHEFSFKKYLSRFSFFEEMGYEVLLFDLDYMSEARGFDPGDTFSLQGQIQLIKENYLKFANHAKGCGYLLTTGHQLIKKAEELARDHRYSVKKFNPSLMADSSDVHRIVDGLVFLQLENNVDGVKFLTAQLRKNRGSKDTPEKDKFFAYAFTEFGIEDDLFDIPKYVTDIDGWDVPQGAKDDAIVDAAMF